MLLLPPNNKHTFTLHIQELYVTGFAIRDLLNFDRIVVPRNHPFEIHSAATTVVTTYPYHWLGPLTLYQPQETA